MVWYFANSACQLFSENGGSTPVIGFHSTMERPDSVNRVAPPTTRVKKIIAAVASSHSRTARRLSLEALTVPDIRICLQEVPRQRRRARSNRAPRVPGRLQAVACIFMPVLRHHLQSVSKYPAWLKQNCDQAGFSNPKSLLLFSVGAELAEIGPKIFCFALVLDAGKHHFCARYLRLRILDVGEKRLFAPHNS